MSDKMDQSKSSEKKDEPPKFTSVLSSGADDSEVSSSRRLEFDLAAQQITDTYPDTDHLLMVYFPQRSEPVLFEDTETILIGRSAGQVVDLDLTSFHGRELGVSRQHAEITFDRGVYYVRDLKSTNGTWLNTKRLEPMKRHAISAGDQLRLGQCLMILYVR